MELRVSGMLVLGLQWDRDEGQGLLDSPCFLPFLFSALFFSLHLCPASLHTEHLVQVSPAAEGCCSYGAPARTLGEHTCLAQLRSGIHLWSLQVWLFVATWPCHGEGTPFSDTGCGIATVKECSFLGHYTRGRERHSYR